MKDTEIKVNGKCVGEYDMCPDAPVIFMDFELKTQDANSLKVTNYYAFNREQFQQVLDRNMCIHVIVDFGRQNNANLVHHMVFPFIRETKRFYPSGDYIGCYMDIPTPDSNMSAVTLNYFLDKKEYNDTGKYKCHSTKDAEFIFTVNISSFDPAFTITKIYATEY